MTVGPVPKAVPETQEFWEGTKRGELRIQRCADCTRLFFYPRPLCRYCGSAGFRWETMSGDATLASYIINHRPDPSFALDAPQIIALVDLKEGVRMLTDLCGIAPDPAAIALDMPLQVRFIERGDMNLPVFVPREEMSR